MGLSDPLDREVQAADNARRQKPPNRGPNTVRHRNWTRAAHGRCKGCEYDDDLDRYGYCDDCDDAAYQAFVWELEG